MSDDPEDRSNGPDGGSNGPEDGSNGPENGSDPSSGGNTGDDAGATGPLSWGDTDAGETEPGGAPPTAADVDPLAWSDAPEAAGAAGNAVTLRPTGTSALGDDAGSLALFAERQNRIEVPHRALVSGSVALFVLALVFVGIRGATDLLPAVLRTAILTVPLIVVPFTFVPGFLFLLAVREEYDLGLEWVAYAGGLSLLLMMAVGLIINLVLPGLGVERPLEAVVYAPAMAALVALLAAAAVRSEGPDAMATVPTASPLAPAPLALLSLPLLAVLAISHMNATMDNRGVIAVYVLVALVPLAAWFLIDRYWHGLAVWTAALSILYTEALAAGTSFPGNPVVVFISIAGRWVPGPREEHLLSTELLQHGTIFPGFAHLTNLDIMTSLAQVNPFFVTLLPVTLFAAFREHVESRVAVLGTMVFVFAHPFYNQYVMAGRSATPVIFVALFALAISDRDLRAVHASAFTMLFGLGVVWTHYGTSYYLMAALLPAAVLLLALWLFDGVVEAVLERGTDVPHAVRSALGGLRDKPRGPGLTVPFVAFFVVATFAWFLFTNGSRGFELFPRQFASVLTDLLTSSDSTGRTAARLERDYGSPVITLSKRLYMLLAALIGVGIVLALLERFEPEGWVSLRDGDGPVSIGTTEAGGRWGAAGPFDDRFIAIAATMLVIFGSTLVFRTWGGGRPMMISFSFTTIFAAYAVVRLGGVFRTLLSREWEREPHWLLGPEGAGTAFAVALAAMFLLNAGVVTAMGVEGEAPSGTPIPGESDLETDVATHAWVIDHNGGYNVYGDSVAFGQTDWRLPAIAAATEGLYRYGPERPRGEIGRLTREGASPGYVLFLGHNVESGNLSLYLEERPIGIIDPAYRENVIYTTGQSNVTFIPPESERISSPASPTQRAAADPAP